MTKARTLANTADALSATSSTELSYLNGLTSAVQTQLNAKQPTVANVSETEIGYLDGVTSPIQTQLDAKQAIVSGVDNTEIGYLNGVTSAIQTQLDSKVSIEGGSTVTVASGATVPLTIQNNGTGNSFVVNDVASDTSNFVVDSSGNVGVGTGSPTAKVTSIADSGGTPLQLGMVASDTSSWIQAKITRNNINQQAAWLYTPSTINASNPTWYTGLNAAAADYVISSYDGTTFSERFKVKPTGATTVSYTTTSDGAVRNIWMSTSNPTGGSDGDVWIKYT
jgi:hypothetical protein